MPEDLPAEKPSENPKEDKKKSKKIWLLILIAIIILAVIGYLGYLFLPASDSSTETEEPTSSTGSAEMATPSAVPSEEEFECSGEVYENTDQGYKVCYEEGWVNREFGTGATTAGFDPTNIPEASEYAGLIVVSVSGSDIASATSEIEGSLEDSSSTTITVDGVEATQISGTEPDNLVSSGGPIIKTLFTHFDRLYVVTLNTNSTENKASYDDLLESWRFLDSAASSAP